MFLEISEEVDELPPPSAPERELAEQRFWRGFLSPLGSRPRHPARRTVLAALARPLVPLRPEDLGPMTPAQLEACYGWVKAQGS